MKYKNNVMAKILNALAEGLDTSNIIPMKYKNEIMAMTSDKLDTSDFILIALKILNNVYQNQKNTNQNQNYSDQIFQQRVQEQFNEIKTAYLEMNYDHAIAIIMKLAKEQGNDDAIYDFFVERQAHSVMHDVPEINRSRRYFETLVSNKMLDYIIVSEEHQNSLSNFYHYVLDKESELLETVNIPNINKSIDEIKKIVPNTKFSIHYILNTIRTIDEYKSVNDEVYSSYTGWYRASFKINNQKDRGELKENSKKDGEIYSDYPISINPGIVKSIFPVPCNELLMDQEELINAKSKNAVLNKIVDLYQIEQTNDVGYSRAHITVPFVNSVSGTAFIILRLLNNYISISVNKGMGREESVDSERKKKDAAHIVEIFIALSCYKGWHSFNEVTCVWGEARKMMDIFQIWDLKQKDFHMYDEIKSKDILGKYTDDILIKSDIFELSALYSTKINNQNILQVEMLHGTAHLFTSSLLSKALSVEESYYYKQVINQRLIQNEEESNRQLLLDHQQKSLKVGEHNKENIDTNKQNSQYSQYSQYKLIVSSKAIIYLVSNYKILARTVDDIYNLYDSDVVVINGILDYQNTKAMAISMHISFSCTTAYLEYSMNHNVMSIISPIINTILFTTKENTQLFQDYTAIQCGVNVLMSLTLGYVTLNPMLMLVNSVSTLAQCAIYHYDSNNDIIPIIAVTESLINLFSIYSYQKSIMSYVVLLVESVKIQQVFVDQGWIEHCKVKIHDIIHHNSVTNDGNSSNFGNYQSDENSKSEYMYQIIDYSSNSDNNSIAYNIYNNNITDL